MAVPSVYYGILQAVQQTITSLNLQLGTTSLPVLLRKMPKEGEDLDTVPAVLVCPSEDAEHIEQASFEGQVFVTYFCEVAIVAANNQDFATNLDSYLAWREKIRQLFQGTSLIGAPTVWDLNPELKGAPVDRTKVNANYDAVSLNLSISSVEQRGNS